LAKGYHSKSPDEFREYLKSLEKNKSKLKWRQIVLLLDVVLLIFVVYLVFRELNPGSFQDPTMSTKQTVDGHSAYLSLSREPDTSFQGYFLFLENHTDNEILFPKTNWKSEFRILTKEGILCYTEDINWETKKIPKFSKGFLYHSVSLEKLKRLPNDCRTQIFDENYSFFRSKFRSLTLNFQTQILLTTDTQKFIFQIQQKPYRIK